VRCVVSPEEGNTGCVLLFFSKKNSRGEGELGEKTFLSFNLAGRGEEERREVRHCLIL